MKKQSGFTLIELMVVMAIIAILATAGLAAYTGYIKKARDTTRIADISAINTIVLSGVGTTGLPPTLTQLKADILAANNDIALIDPQATAVGVIGKALCLSQETTPALVACNYMYQRCNSDTGYRVLTRFESVANTKMYNVLTLEGYNLSTSGGLNSYYAIGNCTAGTPTAPAVANTPDANVWL